MNYSPSCIGSFETCPFKFKLVYIDKKKEPSSPALERGKYVHDYLELKGKELMKRDILTRKNFDSIKVDVYTIDKNIEEVFEGMYDADEVLFEKYVKVPLKNVIISGKIDRTLTFKDKIIITDYKTGQFFKYNKNIYENLQYLIYCWFGYNLCIDIGKRDILFEIIEINNNNVTKKQWKCKYTKEELEEKIYAKVSKILETKTFLPKENPFCRNCYFKPDCDAFKKELAIKSNPNVVRKKLDLEKGERRMIGDNNDYVGVSFKYTIKTPSGSFIGCEASLGKTVKESQTVDSLYEECWKKVEDEVEKRICGLDLKAL